MAAQVTWKPYVIDLEGDVPQPRQARGRAAPDGASATHSRCHVAPDDYRELRRQLRERARGREKRVTGVLRE